VLIAGTGVLEFDLVPEGRSKLGRPMADTFSSAQALYLYSEVFDLKPTSTKRLALPTAFLGERRAQNVLEWGLTALYLFFDLGLK
jgi:hypothetical protein